MFPELSPARGGVECVTNNDNILLSNFHNNYPPPLLLMSLFQVVIVGDGGVGKSSLIRRFCQGVFTSAYKKTIGVDFLEKVVTAENGCQVRLMLWDTAGQEEFDAITRAYYR